MNSADDRVRQAVELARAGKKDEARAELVALVKAGDNNVSAWAALATLADTPKDAAYCLKQVLRLQPDNQWARTQLQRLSQSESQPEQTPQTELPQAADSPRIQRKLIFGAAGALALLCLVGGLLLTQAGVLPGMSAQPAGEPTPQTRTPASMAPASGLITQTTTETMTASPTAPGNAATPRPPRGISPTAATAAQTTQAATSALTSTATPPPTQAQVLTPTDHPTATDPPQPPDVPTSEPPPAAAPCDCYGASLTCRDFDNRAEAQACFEYCLAETDMDIFFLDTDQDGFACENLP